MSSGPSIAMSAIGENAVKRWRDFIGPMDSEAAKRDAPHTLRAIYGTDITKNGVHGSKDKDNVVWVFIFLYLCTTQAMGEATQVIPSKLFNNNNLRSLSLIYIERV